MKKPATYVLDSDVFIAAKNAYYAFDICPGFWEAIVQAHQHDRVRSIDRIKAELLAGQPKEDLVVWVKQTVPAGFFHGTQSKAVLDAYAADQTRNGTQLLGIALDEPDAVRAFLDRVPVRYPNLIEAAGRSDSSIKLGNTRALLPFSALIAADGTILRMKVGAFDDAEDLTAWADPD